MKNIFATIVATLALATSAHAADIVYVGDLGDTAGILTDSIYSGALFDSANSTIVAKVTPSWSKTTKHYETHVEWVGRTSVWVSQDTIVHLVHSNLCNAANGRACLVSENGATYIMYSKVEPSGVIAVYSGVFDGKTVASLTKAAANIIHTDKPTIYTWQKLSDAPKMGGGVCALVGSMKLSSLRLVAGPMSATGEGTLHCWYLSGATSDVNVTLSGQALGLGISAMKNVEYDFLSTGITFNRTAEELFGDYGVVEAGVHAGVVGVRAGLSMNLTSLKNPAVFIPLTVGISHGLGLDVSVNVEQLTLLPTTPEAAARIR